MNYGFLWIFCLAFACAFLFVESMKKAAAAVCLKGIASLCFVRLGYFGSKVTQDPNLVRNVLAGLCLGFLADILLNFRFVFQKAGPKIFLAGILVFLAGHVMYIIALLPRCSSLLMCLIIGALLSVVLILWLYSKITAGPAFKIFGVFYLGAIMIMTVIACGILISAPSVFSGLFAFGALLFLASDIILILNTFGSESGTNLRIMNIMFYYAGQLLIASSLQFA